MGKTTTKTTRGRARGAMPRVVRRRAVADEANDSELEARMREVMQMEADSKIEKEESTMRQTFRPRVIGQEKIKSALVGRDRSDFGRNRNLGEKRHGEIHHGARFARVASADRVR